MSIYLTIIIAIITICISRYILLAFPKKYFSIQDFVSDDKSDISFTGFWIRFGLVFIAGLVILFATKRNIAALVQYGVVFSLLLIWPFFLEKVIFRFIRTKEHKRDYYVFPDTKQLKKLAILNILYAIASILVVVAAIPVYDAINEIPSNIYGLVLEKYVKLDPLAQQVIISAIFWILPTITWKSIKRKSDKKE